MKTALILVSIWATTPAFPVVAAGRLSSSPEAVPFVGCRSDGQLGPRPAPEGMRNAPVLKPPIAGQLAFYAGQELGVLAPRGWSCFELYGSNGSTLIVTPEPHGKDLFKPQKGLETDAVELAYRFGGTSGRFAVASVGARFFPMTRSLVQRVREESVVPIEPVTLTSADRVTSRTASRVTFVTAGDAQGLGTRGYLAPAEHPVAGAFFLTSAPELDLINLNVRLPWSEKSLSAAILREVAQNRGDPRHGPWRGGN